MNILLFGLCLFSAFSVIFALHLGLFHWIGIYKDSLPYKISYLGLQVCFIMLIVLYFGLIVKLFCFTDYVYVEL